MKYDYKLVQATDQQYLEDRLNVFGDGGWRVHSIFQREGFICALLEKSRTVKPSLLEAAKP